MKYLLENKVLGRRPAGIDRHQNRAHVCAAVATTGKKLVSCDSYALLPKLKTADDLAGADARLNLR